jgi:hypothetical protein
MDSILNLLNTLREGTLFPVVHLVASLIAAGVPFMLMAVDRDDLLLAVREAMRLAGITDKAARIDLGVAKGNLADRLAGNRPMTLDVLARMPLEFFQWWPVVLAKHYGLPTTIEVGARLARRQARMTLEARIKAGVA